MGNKGWKKVPNWAFFQGKAVIAGGLIVTLTMYGCAGLRQQMADKPLLSATICGGAGAAAGATTGAALAKKDKEKWAAVGALLGAIVGAASCITIAKFSSIQTKDYQQTKQATGYTPVQGMVVRVERFEVEPPYVSPGGKLTISGQYFVMTPEQDTDLPVIERMFLQPYDEKENQWVQLAPVESKITIKPGTRSILPADITMASKPVSRHWRIVLQVEYNNIRDQKGQVLNIVSRPASAPIDGSPTLLATKSEEVLGGENR